MTTPAGPQAAVTANVASSATSVPLFAAATAPGTNGRTIVNESTQRLYVKFGATASATSYTVALEGAAAPPYAYFEFPQPCYAGLVSGIWASANGSARVTSW